jgi:hypothetical protein
MNKKRKPDFGMINNCLHGSQSGVQRSNEVGKHRGSDTQRKGKRWVKQEITHRKALKGDKNRMDGDGMVRLKHPKTIYHNWDWIKYNTRKGLR